MELNLIPEQEILDFEKENNLTLKVNERPDHRNHKLKKYYVSFSRGEIKDGSFLIGMCGNGDTIDQAIADYCIRISCRTLVLNAFDKSGRNEIHLPRLLHTKLLNK